MAIEVKKDNANGFLGFSLYRIEGIETTQYSHLGMRAAPTENQFVGYVMAREIGQAIRAINAQAGPNRNLEIKSCVEVPADYLLAATGEIKLYNPKSELVDEGDIEAEIAGTCPRRMNNEHAPDYVV